MATPTREMIETCCNKNHLHDLINKSSSWFPSLFINYFVWHFVFGLGSRVPCSSTTILCFFIVTLRFFRSIAVSILMFTRTLQSYLAFEAINMSSQKPCILHTHFTQAYKRLETLSSTIINPCYLHRWYPNNGWVSSNNNTTPGDDNSHPRIPEVNDQYWGIVTTPTQKIEFLVRRIPILY